MQRPLIIESQHDGGNLPRPKRTFAFVTLERPFCTIIRNMLVSLHLVLVLAAVGSAAHAPVARLRNVLMITVDVCCGLLPWRLPPHARCPPASSHSACFPRHRTGLAPTARGLWHVADDDAEHRPSGSRGDSISTSVLSDGRVFAVSEQFHVWSAA